MNSNYKNLGPRAGSAYRQFFVIGTKIRADTLFQQTIGDDARSPSEVAEDFRVPLEAVLEAIEYCRENEELLQQEFQEDSASIAAHGYSKSAPPTRGKVKVQ
jgi:uncharacterized protein (DUF433 family)